MQFLFDVLFVEIWCIFFFFLYILLSLKLFQFSKLFNSQQKTCPDLILNFFNNLNLFYLFKINISLWKFLLIINKRSSIIDPINEKENRRTNIHYLNCNVSSHCSRRKINYTFWNDILRKSINQSLLSSQVFNR